MIKLIISPHLDDAALSLGGYLQNSITENDRILTIFNTAWSIQENESCINDLTLLNLQEELQVIKMLGCKHTFLNFDEALLRNYEFWNSPLNMSADKYHLLNIVNELKSQIPLYQQVFFPMAIGNHVDHLLIYTAVLQIIPLFPHVEFYLYQDLPYATYGGTEERINEIELNCTGLRHMQIDISDNIDSKVELLKSYKSQLTEQDCEAVKTFAFFAPERKYYENIWNVQINKNEG